MSTLVSIKDLLVNNSVVGSATENKKDKKRRASHEFQAYAYRLANDLNDVDNLAIYMRLCKSVPRHIMEEAYSYVADVAEEEKGPLYLWKLKKIRADLKRKKDSLNFEYEFSRKRIMRFRNAIYKTLAKKNSDEFTNALFEPLQLALSVNEQPQSILVLGSENHRLLEILGATKAKVDVLDMSRKVAKLAKDTVGKSYSNLNIISKDFLKHSYDELTYDLVLVPKNWLHVPHDAETKYLHEIVKLAKLDSKVIIGARFSEEAFQKWETTFVNKNEFFYLRKANVQQSFVEQFQNENFQFEHEHTYAGTTYCTFTRSS